MEDAVAATQELQQLQTGLQEIVERSMGPIEERFVGWVENEHAEEQLVRAVLEYPAKLSLAASRAICADRCLPIVAKWFRVYGP